MTDQKYKLVPVEPTEEETLRAVTAERDELRKQLEKYQTALAGHDRRLVRQEKIAAERRRKLEAERDALQTRIAQLEQSALNGYEDGWHALRNERDALRARIEDASIVRAKNNATGVLDCGRTTVRKIKEMEDKRVALVALGDDE